MQDDIYGFVLRFSRRYSMAHRLTGDAAPNCRIPHGHDEVVTIKIIENSNRGLDPETNMLVEFSQAKGRWFEWIDKAVDHTFHLNESDPLIDYFRQNEPEMLKKILTTPGDPTTEIRAACYAAKLRTFLDAENPDYWCLKLTIQETPTNSVEFRPFLTKSVVAKGDQHWWNRPDLSINDLTLN